MTQQPTCGINYIEHNKRKYIHTSQIIKWPNKELATLLNSLPTTGKPWNKHIGKQHKYKGKAKHLDATGKPWTDLGYKNDIYYITETYIANFGPTATIVDFYIKDGTSPTQTIKLLQTLNKQLNKINNK